MVIRMTYTGKSGAIFARICLKSRRSHISVRHMAMAVVGSLDESVEEGPRFSPLDLRDHVVIMALFDQLVSEAEVESVWHVWRMRHLAFFQEPFWRLLLLLPNVNLEQLYEQAARVADIETAYLGRQSVFMAIRHVKHCLPRADWKELLDVPIVPIAVMGIGSQGKGIIFATNDTTNLRVRKLIDKVWKKHYELRYAPEDDLIQLLEEEQQERLTRA